MKRRYGKFLWLAIAVTAAMLAAVFSASADAPAVTIKGNTALVSSSNPGTVTVSYSDAANAEQVIAVGLKLSWNPNELTYVDGSAESKLAAAKAPVINADAAAGELYYSAYAENGGSVVTANGGDIVSAKFMPAGGLQQGGSAQVNIEVTSWGDMTMPLDSVVGSGIVVENGATVLYSSEGVINFGEGQEYTDPEAALNAAYAMTAEGNNVTLYLHSTMKFTEELTIGDSAADTSAFGTVTVKRADGIAAEDAMISLEIPGEYKNVKILTNITFDNMMIAQPNVSKLTNVNVVNAIAVFNAESRYENVMSVSGADAYSRPAFLGNDMTVIGASGFNAALIAGNRYRSGVTVGDSNVTVAGNTWAQTIVGGSYNGSLTGTNTGAVTGNVTLDILDSSGAGNQAVGGCWYSNNYAPGSKVTLNINSTGVIRYIYLECAVNGVMPEGEINLRGNASRTIVAPVLQNSDSPTATNETPLTLNCTINIYEGTFAENYSTVDGLVSALPYNNKKLSKVTGNSTLNIYGGTFNAPVAGGYVHKANAATQPVESTADTELNIYGGTFNKYVTGGYFGSSSAKAVLSGTSKLCISSWEDGETLVTPAFKHKVFGNSYITTDDSEANGSTVFEIYAGTFNENVYGNSDVHAAAALSSTSVTSVYGGTFKKYFIGNSDIYRAATLSGSNTVNIAYADDIALETSNNSFQYVVGNCYFAAGSDGAVVNTDSTLNVTRGRAQNRVVANSEVKADVKNVTVGGSSTLNINGTIVNRSYQVTVRNKQYFYGGHYVNANASITSTCNSEINANCAYFENNVYGGSYVEGEATISGTYNYTVGGSASSAYQYGSLYGGSRVAAAGTLNDSTQSTLTLNIGNYGEAVDGKYTHSVFAGSHVEGTLISNGASSKLDIKGGTFNTDIISAGSNVLSTATYKADEGSMQLDISGGTITKGKIYALGYAGGDTEILNAETSVKISNRTTPELLICGIYSGGAAPTVLNHTGTVEITDSTPKTTVYCGSYVNGSGVFSTDKQVNINLKNNTFGVILFGGEYFLSGQDCSSSGKVEILSSGNTYSNIVYFGSRIDNNKSVSGHETVISADGDTYTNVYGGSIFESKSAGGGEHSGKTTMSVKNTTVGTYCMAGSRMQAASLHSGDSELIVLEGCNFGNNNSIFGASNLDADNSEHSGNSKVVIDCNDTELSYTVGTTTTNTNVYGGCLFGWKGKMTGDSKVEFKSGTAKNYVAGGSLFNNWNGRNSTFTGEFGHYGSSGVVVTGGTANSIVLGGSVSSPNASAAYKADQLLTIGTAGADTESYVEIRGGTVKSDLFGGSYTSNASTASFTVNANTRLQIFDVAALQPSGNRTYAGGSRFYDTAHVQNGNSALIFDETVTGTPAFGTRVLTIAGGIAYKGILNGNSSLEINGNPTLAPSATSKVSGGCIGNAAGDITHNGGSKFVIGGTFTWPGTGDLHAMGINSTQDNGDVELVINGNLTAPANIIGVSWKNILHGNTRIVVNAPLTLSKGTIMAGAYGGKLFGNSTLEINADVSVSSSYIYAGSHGTSELVHDAADADSPYHTANVSGAAADYDFRQVGDVTIKVTNGTVAKPLIGQGQYSFQKGNVNIDITGGTLNKVAAFYNASGAAVSNYGYLEGNVTAYVGGTASFTYATSTATDANTLSAGAYTAANQNQPYSPKISDANYVNGNVDLTIGGEFKIYGNILSAGGTGCSGTHKVKFVGGSFDLSDLSYMYTSAWTGVNAVAPEHNNSKGTLDLSEVTLDMAEYTAWFCKPSDPAPQSKDIVIGTVKIGGSSYGGWAKVIPALMDATTFTLEGDFKKDYNLGEYLDLTGANYKYAVAHPVYCYSSTWKAFSSADISAADITTDTARTYVNQNGKTLTNGKLGAFTTQVKVVLVNGMESVPFDVTVALPEGTTNIGHVGSSIRLSDPRGLRYKADINSAILSATTETDGFVVKKVGTLIAKTATLAGQTVTLEGAGMNSETGKYLIMDVPVYDVDVWGTEKFITSAVRTEGDEEYREFAVVLTGIKTLTQYDTAISFRPYMVIEDEYGDTATFYSTFPQASTELTNGSLSMSIKTVANMITESDYAGYTDDQKAYVDNIRNDIPMEDQE